MESEGHEGDPQQDGFAPETAGPDVGNNAQDRSSLTKIIGKAIGLDITTIAIPVTYNEPTSFLQRMAEFVQAWELLDKANRVVESNPELALLYITAFAVSNFTASERTTKPFNPLLGETFEFIDEESNTRFIAEQVSHHPPVGASHLENANFILEQTHNVKTKFLGNSLEVNPTGKTLITLKATGAQYFFDGVWTVVHNIILGRMWVDHHGDAVVSELNSKRRVELKFKPCGWFSKGWHEVEGRLLSEDDTSLYHVAGLWNQNFYATLLSSNTKKSAKNVEKIMKKQAKKDKKAVKKEAKAQRKAEKKGGEVASPHESDESDSEDSEVEMEEGKPVCLWQHRIKESSEEPYSKWGLTEFTVRLLRMTPEYRAQLPPTDSRLRPDRLALEALDYSLSGKEKFALEEAQRERRRQREEKDIPYKQQFFELIKLPNGEEVWTMRDNLYWKQREARLSESATTSSSSTDSTERKSKKKSKK